ncbi:MAG TPA: DMT family transporter [Vicinamibacteria bacterium]|nr:DMT family transporter [Vicinamibacteria bacterium]
MDQRRETPGLASRRREPGRPGSVARADLLAVLAVANWGLSYGLTKLAFREWRPLVFTGTRFLAMAAIALVVLAAQGRLGAVVGPDRARFALGGLFGFTLYQLGFTLGLDRTSAFASTLLLSTVPLFSLLFLRLGGVESVGRRQWAGVGLATAGILLFVSGTPGGLRFAEARMGDLLSLGAAASFALYGIVSKPLAARHPASTVLAGTLLIGSVPLVPLGLLGSAGQSWGAISPSGWAIWIYAVVFPIYLAYTWWTTAIALRGVAAVAPYVLLVPIVGGLFALVWLGESVGLLSGAGAALTLLGLAQSRGWLPRRGQRPPDA